MRKRINCIYSSGKPEVKIAKTVVVKNRYYTKVFGKVINIKESELPIYKDFTIYEY